MKIRIQSDDDASSSSPSLKNSSVVAVEQPISPTWTASIPASRSSFAADRGSPWSSSSFMAEREVENTVIEVGGGIEKSLPDILIFELGIFLA